MKDAQKVPLYCHTYEIFIEIIEKPDLGLLFSFGKKKRISEKNYQPEDLRDEQGKNRKKGFGFKKG